MEKEKKKTVYKEFLYTIRLYKVRHISNNMIHVRGIYVSNTSNKYVKKCTGVKCTGEIGVPEVWLYC